MKRIGNIYPKIYDLNNLRLALHEASRGKQNRKYIKHILDNEDEYLLELHDALKNKALQLNPNRHKRIIETSSRKERNITIPAFYPDQVIHWALILQIQDIMMKGMYRYSCGSVPKRGTHYAKHFVEKVLRQRKPRYALKIDIRKFFENINTDKLMQRFERKIKDQDVLDLIEMIIENALPGLPIGYYTSQWFSNFYLEELDHYIKEKLHIKWYVRYVDDMILFGNNKRELHKARLRIAEFLRINSYRLDLKQNWQVFKIASRSIDFVGYKMGYDKTKVRKRIFIRIHRTAKSIKRKQSSYMAARYISLVGWLIHATGGKQCIKNHLDRIIPLEKTKKLVSKSNSTRIKTQSKKEKRFMQY